MRKQQTLSTYDEVKEKALRLLEFRSHSEKELSDKLSRLGASRENIDMTLEFCRRYGFVNDEYFAECKARDLFNLKRYGRRRICAELKALGISEELTERALSQLDGEDEGERLRGYVQKRLRGDFSEKNKEKCIRYFIYRGYDLYDIKDVIQALEEESE